MPVGRRQAGIVDFCKAVSAAWYASVPSLRFLIEPRRAGIEPDNLISGHNVALAEEPSTAKGARLFPLGQLVPGRMPSVGVNKGRDHIDARAKMFRQIVGVDGLKGRAAARRPAANPISVDIKLIAAVGRSVDAGAGNRTR